MKISILSSDPAHPVGQHLRMWVERHSEAHEVTLATRKSELPGGDYVVRSLTEVLAR